MVYTTNNGGSWEWKYVDDSDTLQYWKACTKRDGYYGEPNLFVGTNTVRKWPHLGHGAISKYPAYTLNDIAYKQAGGIEWCVAVGTPRYTTAGRIKQNLRYWYGWAGTPSFEITSVEAITEQYQVTIRLEIDNNTGNRDTLRVQIWQSPCEENGSGYDMYLRVKDTLFTLERGENTRYVSYRPDCGHPFYYGASLYHTARDIAYSHNVSQARAWGLPYGPVPSNPTGLTVNDYQNDHGSRVVLDWTGDSEIYLCCRELDAAEVYVEPKWVEATPYRGELRFEQGRPRRSFGQRLESHTSIGFGVIEIIHIGSHV